MHHRRLPSHAALALLAAVALDTGCSACGRFADIEVTGGDPEDQQMVRTVLSDFAAATGRSEICVTKVELAPMWTSKGRASLGNYHSARGRIRLSTMQTDPERTLVHELCHAVDLEDGISASYAGLFPYDPDAHDYDFRSPDSRTREAFAVACEAGPDELATAIAVAGECQPEVATAGLSVVLDEVYVGAPAEPTGAGAPDADFMFETPDGAEISGECLD